MSGRQPLQVDNINMHLDKNKTVVDESSKPSSGPWKKILRKMKSPPKERPPTSGVDRISKQQKQQQRQKEQEPSSMPTSADNTPVITNTQRKKISSSRSSEKQSSPTGTPGVGKGAKVPKPAPTMRPTSSRPPSSSGRTSSSSSKSRRNRIDNTSGPIDGDTLKPFKETTETNLYIKTGQPSSSSIRKYQQGSNARVVLDRDFGRISLPTEVARKWVVEVGAAEWDADENQWKYRIMVQHRDTAKKTPIAQIPGSGSGEASSSLLSDIVTKSSFTTAFTWRSLADFCWLEDALKAEFHGALMLPVLSIALGIKDLASTDYEVDANLLRDWLGDVLNGIRGQGEFMVNMDSVDILASESMESFLYRNTENATKVDKSSANSVDGHDNILTCSTLPPPSSLDMPWAGSEKGRIKEMSKPDEYDDKEENDVQYEQNDEDDNSFVKSLWTKPFGQLDNMCGLSVPAKTEEGGQDKSKTRVRRGPSFTQRLSVGMAHSCSSRAVADAASLQISDSFVEMPQEQLSSSQLAQHSELLEALKEHTGAYKESALVCMEKVQVLKEKEAQVGDSWKFFAITLTNLFTIEKEIEGTRLGQKEKKDKMPYRKLNKNSIDDCLRILTKQKLERAAPGLNSFSSMLGSYVGDLSSVEPAIDAYLEALDYLARLDEKIKDTPDENEEINGILCGVNSLQIQDQFRSWTAPFFGKPLKDKSDSVLAQNETKRVATRRKLVFEHRVLSNESLLRTAVTDLCKANAVRSSRMAWKYFKKESGQAALTSGAAISLRTKINSASERSINEMAARHQKQEKEDRDKEVELIQKIVSLGINRKKFVPGSDGTMDDNEYPEIDNDEEDREKEMAKRRDRAMDLARRRVGRWNAEMANAIVDALGIEDKEVKMEETTRDLRSVREHAITLRENWTRCVEAVENLKAVILDGKAGTPPGDGSPGMDIVEYDKGKPVFETRREFVMEMGILFGSASAPSSPGTSYKAVSESPSKSVLFHVGIEADDPAGWNTCVDDNNGSTTVRKEVKTGGQCGALALQYATKRDSNIQVFLNKISDFLKLYDRRVELVESVVYMQCVAISIEKHFNKKRSQALAAWEKKTDITTAINIATRKKIPALVAELQAKMAALNPPNVSHTTVIETKDDHLASKALKSELKELSSRAYLRARESSVEYSIELINMWSRYEEDSSIGEIGDIARVLDEVEKNLRDDDIPRYLRRHEI